MYKDTIKITLPDGTTALWPIGITGSEIAQQTNKKPTQPVLSALINGVLWDLTRPIHKDATIRLLTWDDEAGKRTFWHSSAHLMAEALEALYPGIKLGIGPPIEQGFYYDIDFGTYTFDATHLPALEAKMLALAQQKNPYQRIEIKKEAAIQYFETRKNPYKLALLKGLQDGQITFYQQGNFIDLCKGPHIPHTGFICSVKLLNIAGAYWQGSERNKQLTRIYGITFPQQKQLKIHLISLAKAQNRNHQKLGRALKLFAFSNTVGIGLPLWLPRGAVLREELIQFLKRIQLQAGYQPVVTPHIGHKALYVTSGHYEKYGQDSFQPIHTPHEDGAFLLKPMNCPHHCEIYKYEPRSYRDLPIRLAEFGTVYRYEQHGELHGLTRARCFTQDDAHIFCRVDQIKEELTKVIDLVLYVFKTLDFTDYMVQLSLRHLDQPAAYMGKAEDWAKAEQAMQEVLIEKKIKFTQAWGEAAFYGPKLDFMVRDALGRSWQLGTVQLDYQLPEQFKLVYTGADNQQYRPVMIHRAPLGSLERFIAILLEHTGGELPLWLAPEQVAILPLAEKYNAYANQVYKILMGGNVRSFVDRSSDKISKKIRNAELYKIPYMLILGEKEQQRNEVAVRKHSVGDQGNMPVNEFMQRVITVSSYTQELY